MGHTIHSFDGAVALLGLLLTILLAAYRKVWEWLFKGSTYPPPTWPPSRAHSRALPHGARGRCLQAVRKVVQGVQYAAPDAHSWFSRLT